MGPPRRRAGCVPAAALLLCPGAGALGASEAGPDASVFRPCGLISHQQKPLGCHEAVETDCTAMRHLARLCPQSCPFVAPHPELSCVFECASSSSCSKTNAEFAFPNNRTYVCEQCNVVGCRRCSSPDLCLECFDNFWLELGGRVCAYVWEDRAKTGVHLGAVIAAVLVILGSFVILILDHCNCCGRCLPQGVPLQPEDLDGLDEEQGSEKRQDARSDTLGAPLVDPVESPSRGGSGELHAEEDPTLIALNVGNRHRLRCKIKDLEVAGQQLSEAGADCEPRGPLTASSLSRFRRIPIWVNFNSRFLAGVGLPLFHQWYYFLFLYSAMMCAGTAWVYYGSDLSSVLQTYGLDHASKMLLLGQDTMSFCEMRDRKDDIGAAVRAFAHRCAAGYLVLWVLGLCASLMHAARQKKVATAFYHKHPCLAEFVLNVEGFPPEATDEDKIRSFLCEAFGCEALEVSVCYDYRSRRTRVHELLEKVLVLEDVRAGTYDPALAAGGAGGLDGLGLCQEEKDEVLGWLTPGVPGGLRNAGSVFAVLPHYYDLQHARRKFDTSSGSRTPMAHSTPSPPRGKRSRLPLLPHSPTPEWLPPLGGSGLKWVGDNGRISELVIRDVVCEPPDVVWDHLGLETSRLACRYLGGIGVIVISFVAMAAGIFVPLARYSIAYVYQAGSFPTGVIMTVVGTLQMTANWVICILHCFVSSRVGFARRDREGLLIFKAFAVLCLVGFLFNVTITIFPESSAHGGDPLRFFLEPLSSSRRAIDSIKEVSFQVRASVHLFHVLIPGTLFIGYLVWPLQGFVWPLVSTFTFLRCWHRRSFMPDLTAREAELALEPLGMSIGHDYMGHIVQPVSCTLVLFFASGVAWQVFGFMALWSLFMSPFMRYLHLRAVRRCYHTTNRLDTEVLFWWGFPLSMVLAASCFWAARLRGWPMYVVPAAWAVGNALYAGLLALWIRPLSPPKEEGHAYCRPSYDEVRSRRFYDWHNCNPIKVLLSHCEEGKGPPITPFQVGKEYLQANDPSWRARMRKVARSANLYTSVDSSEAALGMVGCLRHLQVPEVETLIARPLERILSVLGGTSNRRGALANRAHSAAATTPRRPSSSLARSRPSARTPEQCESHHGSAASGAAAAAGAAAEGAASRSEAGARPEGGGPAPSRAAPLPACAAHDDAPPSSRGHGRYL